MTLSAAHSILPPLSADEQQHSAAVAARLRATVAEAGGWLSFERFMEIALYEPGLGYYSAGSAKFGAAGDFVTAPEISDLFSRCVARQCAEVLATTGGEILELGAGTGRMAAVVLESLGATGVLPQRYAILEVSADLAERQRARLQSSLTPALFERVVWLERLPGTPVRGVILANEVLDALPCRRFVVGGDARVLELGVSLSPSGAAAFSELAGGPEGSSASAFSEGAGESEGSSATVFGERAGAPDGSLAAAFSERARAADVSLAAAVEKLLGELPQELPAGYVSELCLRVDPWMAGVGSLLERGMILLFDYGLPRSHYYHPQRVSGTLRCHFKQRAHDDPYINVGVQDITAWVDFTRVAEAALTVGLDVAGFCTQAAFLLATGIEALTAEAVGTVEHARRAGEARRLLMPGEMGESFKAMALTRDYDAALGGFALQDLRHSL
jgi:SAM-dependent MidA family methyltransferase